MGHAITGGGFFNIDVEPIKEPSQGELYEAVIHDVARFDAGIDVLTLNQQFRINYDTPYIRNLPTRPTTAI
jgi:hypothetical protein